MLGAAGMIAFAIFAVTSLSGGPPAPPTLAATEIAISRDLVFVDREQGGIAVLDGDTHATITILEPGTNGFIRGVMRGLARDRGMRGIGPDAPFRLIERTDGRLTLLDPSTDRQIELGAFGQTNVASFAQLLHGGGDNT